MSARKRRARPPSPPPQSRLSARWVLAIAALALGAVVAWWALRPAVDTSTASSPDRPATPQATFVGAATCATCHKAEAEMWRASMHAHAMEVPSASSVKAPFEGERVTFHGVTSTFNRANDTYVVRTDGPDGVVRDYDVAYTFGIDPLQQYLVALPGGRLQALGLAWDGRQAPRGRRWYHLYPQAPPGAGDPQHWTNRPQTWNSMCAACHSTNLKKRYDEAQDRYDTTWSDLNVGCEACHGPGSRHVAWAGARTGGAPAPGEDTGLIALEARDGAAWAFDATTGIAHRDRPRTSRVEVEMCARCHSRRSQLTDDDEVSQPLTSSYRPALLEDGLYFADGQMLDEVYEYGSFLQSRMYAHGVTCNDCHEPHKPEIESAPDAVCERCHRTSSFATPAHHHHRASSPGASCVACHMPARTYMTVDARRDHSFRVPRPDLTVKIATPNACTGCHENRPAAWAAQQANLWWGSKRTSQAHYGEALAAGRTAAADAQPRLLAVVDNPALPGIVRATAVSLLQSWIDSRSAPALRRATQDPDALVRMAAADVLTALPGEQRALVLAPMLSDPARAVRIQAARALATAPEALLSGDDRARLARGLAEWEVAQRFGADTAAARVALGALYAERNEPARARQEYDAARRLEPYFAPAAVNLADLHRVLGQDDEGEKVLREAIARTPEVSALHQALGLVLVRRKNLPAAVAELRRAAALAPDNTNAQYTLAVALFSTGRQAEAIDLLERTWRARPGDPAVLTALVSYVRERGDLARAETLAARLVELSPGDPSAQATLAEIRAARGR